MPAVRASCLIEVTTDAAVLRSSALPLSDFGEFRGPITYLDSANKELGPESTIGRILLLRALMSRRRGGIGSPLFARVVVEPTEFAQDYPRAPNTVSMPGLPGGGVLL